MASLTLLCMPAESLLGCNKQTNKQACNLSAKTNRLCSEVNEQLKLYFLTTENKLKIKVTVWRSESKGDWDREMNKQSSILFSKEEL